ncbi:fucose-1-phosphate guanylyltransferase [Aplysia californica]|uniref:Fucose-1-phosphate guanylyltransferase n=1 Tax=Aplysia californica TaxID=6500 RepID=A0ABM0ZV42_APLCA|nr:fucose-1-phosphate guanylyltransferase [Aplysia californica]
MFFPLPGRPKDSSGKPFWDILVITTSDASQKEAFQIQIDEKIKRQELPLDLPIHIISDPPGIRIGNGGSTLVALEKLESEYGSELFQKKILLIHAGGWSQRMPSSTILGKAFSLLPHGNPPYQMLDLKLALYWPFVEKVQPGVFIACADDFVVYSLGSDVDWECPANGFIALAHPSPISIGRTHGVYVLSDVDKIDTEKKVVVSNCLEVLQKPSDERMKTRGAVLKGDSHTFADGICVQGETVYTDSCFYFGMDVVKKLLNFKKSAGDLSCEIDAYGDFLQAVGKNATSSYIHNVGNVSQKTSNLLEMRQGVFDCLNGSDIHVLVLNASAFIHIGTTKELLYHFCQDADFQAQLAFEKDVFNVWLREENSDNNIKRSDRNPEKISADACVMHSAFYYETRIDGQCVIDFCDFDVPVHISSKCILSNCQLSLLNEKNRDAEISIPPSMFFNTVPIVGARFVTVYFSIGDNLKKSVCYEDIESLPFMDSDVGHFLEDQGYTIKEILPSDEKNNSNSVSGACTSPDTKHVDGMHKDNKKTYSLWNLRLYPAAPSMTSSLEEALQGLSSQPRRKVSKASKSMHSMADLLKIKDVKAMLKFRSDLFEKIRANE